MSSNAVGRYTRGNSPEAVKNLSDCQPTINTLKADRGTLLDMQPTRRTVEVAAIALALAVFAMLLDRPLALAGAIVCGAWAIGHQIRLDRVTRRLVNSAVIEQDPRHTDVRIDQENPTTLSIGLFSHTPLPITLTAGVPTAARLRTPLSLSLSPGENAASTTTPIVWPVAGRHRFDRATLTVSTPVVTQSVPVGATPTVTVTPRGPRGVHVGAGGEAVTIGYGEWKGDRRGAGLEPSEIRAYQPGDDTRRIDWNATARLTDVYVREFEVETDRRTLLVCDHRTSMTDGHQTETKLDYCRTLALAVADMAYAHGDPLGLVTVDDDGISDRVPPGTSVATRRAIRETLLELTVVAEDVRRGGVTRRTSAEMRRTAAALNADDSAFGRTLTPFYRAPERVPIAEDPLATAVRTVLRQERGTTLTVFVTDDAARPELREAVQLASRPGRSALVLIAPTALFVSSDPTDTYREYVDFERFRRHLDARPRVRALEVGPRDSVATVLASGARQRRRQPS